MARESQKIDTERLHVDRADAGGLRCIDRETDTGLSGQRTDFGDRLQCAGYVRGMGDDDQTGLRRQQTTD